MSVLRYVDAGPLLLVVVLAGVLSGCVGAPAWRRGQRRRAIAFASRALLCGAVVVVLAVTLTTAGGSSPGVNLVPFAGIGEQLDNVNRELAIANIVGNILMFVPLGLLVVPALGLSFRRASAACLLFSLGIEITQLLLGRSADIDDLMLNGAGGAAGAAVACVIRKHFDRRQAGSRGPRIVQSVATTR